MCSCFDAASQISSLVDSSCLVMKNEALSVLVGIVLRLHESENACLDLAMDSFHT